MGNYRQPPSVRVAVLYTVRYGDSLVRQGIAVREVPSLIVLAGTDPVVFLKLLEAETAIRTTWFAERGPNFRIDQIIPLTSCSHVLVLFTVNYGAGFFAVSHQGLTVKEMSYPEAMHGHDPVEFFRLDEEEEKTRPAQITGCGHVHVDQLILL